MLCYVSGDVMKNILTDGRSTGGREEGGKIRKYRREEGEGKYWREEGGKCEMPEGGMRPTSRLTVGLVVAADEAVTVAVMVE